MDSNRVKKFFIIFLKGLGWLLSGFLALFLLLLIILQIPKVQREIASVASNYLSRTINTPVDIARISINLPKAIILKDVYIQDQNKDTLWYSHYIKVDFDMIALLQKRVQINSLYLENAKANITRTLPDSLYNFDFIINSFTNNEVAKEKQDTGGTAWDFMLYNLEIKNLSFALYDAVSAGNLDLSLGYFNVDVNDLNLENNHYYIDAVFIENSQLSYVTLGDTVKTEEEPTSWSGLPFIKIDEFNISNFNVVFDDKESQQYLKLALGQFGLNDLSLDLPSQRVDLDKIGLHNSDITFSSDESKETNEDSVSTEIPGEEINWMLALQNLDFSNLTLNYNNYSQSPIAKGIDFNRLGVSNFKLTANDIFFKEDSIEANIEQLAFVEKSGFKIEQMATNIIINKKRVLLENFLLETSESYITNNFEFGFPSFETVANNPEDVHILANFSNSFIGIKDLLYFSPELSHHAVIRDNSEKNIILDGAIEGLVSNLTIDNFTTGFSPSTRIFLNGNINGLPHFESAFFNLTDISIQTRKSDLESILQDSLFSAEISIPEIIALNAVFKGTMSDFKSSMNLNTSLGNLSADMILNTDSILKTEKYIAHLSAIDLNLGKLLKQEEMLGNFEFVAKVNGSGLSMESIAANLDARIKKAIVNNYEYKDIRLNGLIKQQQFTGNLNIADKNLDLTFDGNVNFNGRLPDVTAKIDLKGADLRALNFSKEDFRVQGLITADILGNNIDSLEGDISIRNVLIIKNDKNYRIDSLLFTSVRENENTNINIHSDFLTATFKGTINPSDIGAVIENHVNDYFDLQNPDTIQINKDLKPQNFDFELNISDAVILTEVLVPGLQELKPVVVSGRYNSLSANLDLKVNMPLIKYKDITADSLFIRVSSDQKALAYSFLCSKLSTSSITLQHPSLTGVMADNVISTRFNLTDSLDKIKFGLTAMLRSIENEFTIHLLPDQVIMNYNIWEVPLNNSLSFSKKGILVNNLSFRRDEQIFTINTGKVRPADTLQILFDNFEIENFSNIIEQNKEPLYRGEINGQVLLLNLQHDNLAFVSDLEIEDFSFKMDTVGNISIKANSSRSDLYNITAAISGRENNVNINGTYGHETQRINLIMDVQNLALKTVESFIEEQITELSGNMRGNLRITGTVEDPDVDGLLKFKETGFNMTTLNVYFTLSDEVVFFDNRGINLKSLTLKDSLGNTAIVDGYLLTENYRDIFFELDVKTENFLALNTTKEEAKMEDALYFGTLIADSDLKIRGNLLEPVIDASVHLLEESNLTYTIPMDEVTAVEREGVVEFIVIDKEKESSIMSKDKTQDSAQTEIRGIELRANITIDEGTILRINIDESTGDYIEVKGGGTISYSMYPSGIMTLTGVYEIDEGSYRLSFYDMVKRDFAIKQGGTITWTGDPLNAEVNITAIYTIRTSPSELMEAQMQEMDEQQQGGLKQPLPFEVFLNMRGNMLQPEIDFSIELPEDRKSALDGTVYRRLQILNEQENELNKQVFALLVLSRFLPEDPLEPASGGGLTGAARSSASKILTQQLNQLASRHLKGVDLTFDLESFEDATELQVELEREFLDERLRVEIGGRVDVEGERRRQGGSDIAGDVAAEYLLTPDGRLRLRAFRKNEYQMILDGDVIETGLSLIFSRDFNNLKDILKRKNKNNKKNGKKDESGELIQSPTLNKK